jgi:hypothetical protein
MPPIGSEGLARLLGASFLALVVAPVAYAAWHLRARLAEQPQGKEGDYEAGEEDEGYVPVTSYESLIGNTPMIELRTASALTGCRILVKMESMNPGGTGKDRAARAMLREALEAGRRCNRGFKPGFADPSNSDSIVSRGIGSTSSGGCGTLPRPVSRADVCRATPLRRGGHVVEGTSGRYI